VQSKSRGGETPLHFAANEGKVEAARDLLSNGANVNAKCNAGWTPLHLAAQAGKVGVIENDGSRR